MGTVIKALLPVGCALLSTLPACTSAQVLYELASPDGPGGYFGASVSGASDVNADGYNDIIVGAYHESPGPSPIGARRVHVFSGACGSLLYTLVSPNEQEWGRFGNSVAGLGDLDNDGCSDLVVGARDVVELLTNSSPFLHWRRASASPPGRSWRPAARGGTWYREARRIPGREGP